MILLANNSSNVQKHMPIHAVFIFCIVSCFMLSAVKMEQNKLRSPGESNRHRRPIRPSMSSPKSPQTQQKTAQDGGFHGKESPADLAEMSHSNTVTENTLQSFSNQFSMQSKLNKEKNYEDSEHHSRASRVSFKALNEAIHFWFLGNYRLYFLCDPKCKKQNTRLLCSCSPSCVFLGTCCLNFQEMCSNITRKPQELEKDVNLLKHASTECINGRHVITSCPENTVSFVEGSEKALPEEDDFREHGDVPVKKETILQEERILYQESRKAPPLTVLDLLKLMAYNSTLVPATLNNVMSNIISTTPILDRDSGLSFRNISVFSCCNVANLDRSQLWDVDLTTKKGQLLPSSELPTLEYLLNRVNNSDKHSTNRFSLRRDVFSANHMCSLDSINSCPDNYHDEDVNSACRDIYLPVTVDDFKKGPIYKNPFCVTCNEGIRDFSLKMPSVMLHNVHISLEFNISSPNLTVLRRVQTQVKYPIWRSLTCQLQTQKLGREVKYLQNKTGRCELVYTRNASACTFSESAQSLMENTSLSSLCCGTNDDEQNKSGESSKISTLDFTQQHQSGLKTLNSTEKTGNPNDIKRQTRDHLPGMRERESQAQQHEPEGVAACTVSACAYSIKDTPGGCFANLTALLYLPPPSISLTEDDVYRHLLSYKSLLTKILPTTRAKNEDNVEFVDEAYGNRNYMYIFTMKFFIEVYQNGFTSDEKEQIVDFFLNGSYPFRDDSRFVCVQVGLHVWKGNLCSPYNRRSHDERHHLLFTVVWVAVIRLLLQ